MAYPQFNFLSAGVGLALSLALGLSGCTTVGMAEASSQMGSSVSDGVARQASNIGGLFGGGTQKEALSVPVFVVSTRKGGANSTELTPGAQARYALNFVSVPPGHSSGVIETPNFGGPDPTRHFTVTSRRSLDDTQFEAEVAAHVSGRIGVNRDILIYVHGFNTSLEEARFRLAQIVVDGEFGGVPIL